MSQSSSSFLFPWRDLPSDTQFETVAQMSPDSRLVFGFVNRAARLLTRRFPHSFLGPSFVTSSARLGHTNILNWLFETFKIPIEKNVLREAAIHGQVGVLKWAKSMGLLLHDQGLVSSIAQSAASEGQFDVVEYLQRCGFDQFYTIMSPAVRHGYQPVIKEVLGNLGSLRPAEFGSLVSAAAAKGNLEVLTSLQDKIGADPALQGLMGSGFILGGHVEVLQWSLDRGYKFMVERLVRMRLILPPAFDILPSLQLLFKHRGFDPTIFDSQLLVALSGSGRIETLRWVDATLNLPFPPDSVYQAAIRGEINCLRFLVVEHELPVSFKALLAAVEGHHRAAILFFLDLDLEVDMVPQPTEDDTNSLLEEAARYCDLDIVERIFNRFGNPSSVTSSILEKAVKGGRPQVVRFILNRKPPEVEITKRCILNAIDSTRLEVVQLLHENGGLVIADPEGRYGQAVRRVFFLLLI